MGMLSLIEVPLKRIPEFQRFSYLKERVRRIARQVVDDQMAATSESVSNFIQIELAFINKSHPDFLSGKKAITNYLIATAGQASSKQPGMSSENEIPGNTAPSEIALALPGVPLRQVPPGTPTTTGAPSEAVSDPESVSTGTAGFLTFWRRHPLQPAAVAAPQQSARSKPRLQPQPSGTQLSSPMTLPAAVPDMYQSEIQMERDALEVDLVKVLITSYFNIVKKTLADIVPKTIMHLLVNATNKTFHGKLVTSLYRNELFSELLQEDASVPMERVEIEKQLRTFRKAHEILASMRKSIITKSPRG
eukprot:Protomagalhaensia_wolfi_Nauph_80__39@NODE_1023_length_1801_cov_93_544268_g94_i1_p1_GENE_NODE_1023_length_1801_cov_93_544268_g94_i1NODE_1023_length_1801_cov_93_544268_g94_i1_p1_ORF_typecomplete_len305_score38_23GED/PF02212_18/6_8e24Dynamin_M/PF01031_20/0_09_NODE_1023_length_1801_cov_93_544268_g94_i13761290